MSWRPPAHRPFYCHPSRRVCWRLCRLQTRFSPTHDYPPPARPIHAPVVFARVRTASPPEPGSTPSHHPPPGYRLPAAAGHLALLDASTIADKPRLPRSHRFHSVHIGIEGTAIGDYETFDYSRLRQKFASVECEGQCKPSVVEHSLRTTAS